MASVPNVPGLNRTQLVSVGIFGEALCIVIRSPELGAFELLEVKKVSWHPGNYGGK